MNLAKVSTARQITIPIDVCRQLKIKPGSKVLFAERANGEIVIENAETTAMRAFPTNRSLKKAQKTLRGAADTAGLETEDDIMRAVREVRYDGGAD